MKFPPALTPSHVTLLGYGALLSESSSRLTFPHLTNFRHVRVFGLRRVFAHPHLFLIGEDEKARKKKEEDDEEKKKKKNGRKESDGGDGTLEMASLSVEPAENGNISFVAAAFDVELDDAQRKAFLKREPEYRIGTTQFCSLSEETGEAAAAVAAAGEGVICLASCDTDLDPRLIEGLPSGIETVWNWSYDSGILPHRFYLRHCLLAVSSSSSSMSQSTNGAGVTKSSGGGARAAYESFLNDTYLADRKTTLKEYLEVRGEEVMASRPPEYLKERYSG